VKRTAFRGPPVESVLSLRSFSPEGGGKFERSRPLSNFAIIRVLREATERVDGVDGVDGVLEVTVVREAEESPGVSGTVEDDGNWGTADVEDDDFFKGERTGGDGGLVVVGFL
jgi:hypothetical protein